MNLFDGDCSNIKKVEVENFPLIVHPGTTENIQKGIQSALKKLYFHYNET